MPLVKPAAGFVFRRSHEFPRLVINEAGVHVTDNVYGITPKSGFTIRGICYSFYNSLTFLFAEMDGRFYGGGVLELSPVEFRNLPLAYHEPSDAEFEAFLNVHQLGDVDAMLDFGDGWLARKLQLPHADLDELRIAWSSSGPIDFAMDVPARRRPHHKTFGGELRRAGHAYLTSLYVCGSGQP